MSESKLAQAQSLVDQLGPADQARLMTYLATRLAMAIAPLERPSSPDQIKPEEAWQRFWQIGEALGSGDPSTGETLTAAVLSQRR